MTEEAKARIDLYRKTGKLPHPMSLADDLGITPQDAQTLINEYRELYSRPNVRRPPNPANPSPIHTIPTVTQEEWNKKTETPIAQEKAKDFHDVVARQGAGVWVLRVISFVIAVACMIRGFMVILEINSTAGWQGYLNAIIFQGASAILPIVAMLYFSSAIKKPMNWIQMLIGLFFIVGGAASMSYEVYASIASFHQINIKQEILLTEIKPITDDPILMTLELNIKLENDAMARTQALLSQRVDEANALPPEAIGKATAEARVRANRADLETQTKRIQAWNADRTARILFLEKENESNSSALGMASSGDQDVKNGFEFLITGIPSAMMVIFTPIFFGLALFGIHVRRKE
jgi:hypothetical protein